MRYLINVVNSVHPTVNHLGNIARLKKIKENYNQIDEIL